MTKSILMRLVGRVSPRQRRWARSEARDAEFRARLDQRARELQEQTERKRRDNCKHAARVAADWWADTLSERSMTASGDQRLDAELDLVRVLRSASTSRKDLIPRDEFGAVLAQFKEGLYEFTYELLLGDTRKLQGISLSTDHGPTDELHAFLRGAGIENQRYLADFFPVKTRMRVYPDRVSVSGYQERRSILFDRRPGQPEVG